MNKYEAMAMEICKKHLVTFPEFVEAVAQALRQVEADTIERAAKKVEDHLIYTGPGGIDPEPIQKILAKVIRTLKNEAK